MMTDQELLGLAAKAGGFSSIDFLAQDRWANVYESDGRQSAWNPLADDGDALRLAVKLGIIVCVDYEIGYVGIHLPGCRGKYDFGEQLSEDPYSATRRVIVRAAAEIGKAMQ